MPSLCVFLASGRGADPIYVETARATGAAIAARGWRVVYGGAHRGLMGELADAALAAGGEVIGVLPRDLEAREIAHRGLTSLEIVDSMAERKDRMFALADGFLTLPGGYGTLDETFEALTAAQLGHHTKPIVVYDVAGYYAPLAAWVEGAVRAGLVAATHATLWSIHRDLDAALDAFGWA
jgi:uncharacterized protein (TIGR00730 family)